MKNYIKRLEAENKIYKETIDDLLAYLRSEKFHADTQVQVQDIFNRVDEMNNRLFYEVEN
jgi:hypothetical protein